MVYGFADASGSGFGSSFENKNGLKYRFGCWGKDEAVASSNYKELKNLVEALQDMAQDGDLQDTEIFLFTNNSVAESVYYKGLLENIHLF